MQIGAHVTFNLCTQIEPCQPAINATSSPSFCACNKIHEGPFYHEKFGVKPGGLGITNIARVLLELVSWFLSKFEVLSSSIYTPPYWMVFGGLAPGFTHPRGEDLMWRKEKREGAASMVLGVR